MPSAPFTIQRLADLGAKATASTSLNAESLSMETRELGLVIDELDDPNASGSGSKRAQALLLVSRSYSL